MSQESLKNKTKMTFAVQMELSKLSTKKIKIISLITGIIAIILGALLFENSKVLGVGLVVIGIMIIIALVLLLNRLMAREIAKSNLYNGEIDNSYEFFDDGFTVTTYKNSKIVGESKLNYADIIKIIEDQNLIYIYINKNHAFALSKKAMVVGKIGDLQLLLKDKVLKYKVIK